MAADDCGGCVLGVVFFSERRACPICFLTISDRPFLRCHNRWRSHAVYLRRGLGPGAVAAAANLETDVLARNTVFCASWCWSQTFGSAKMEVSPRNPQAGKPDGQCFRL